MDANQKATVTDVSQQKVVELQSEWDVIETKIKNNQVMSEEDSEKDNNQLMSEEDVKFVGELGWLSAAAVLIASIAAGL